MPDSMYLTFDMPRAFPAMIHWPRMMGYFYGEVTGIDFHIDPKFRHRGALGLDWHGAPL